MLYLGSEGTVNAAFAMIQQVRPEAAASLEGLRKMGISLAMLTGDDRSSAESLGRALKISDVRAGLTPEEKVLAIKDAQPTSQHVAMVGDGINDAAALAAADVGIAAGCGTDIAREAADVTIISEDLTQLPWLFYFARRVRRVMLTNLGWSFAYNIVGIGLALTGWLPPVLAAIAMVLSSAFVLGNTLLLLSERTKGSVAMVLFHAGSASQDGAEEKPRWAYV
jgi:Cu2+-exporting ATPase/Cu+-exporting ATPase